MSNVVKPMVHDNGVEGFLFYCPGCKSNHAVYHKSLGRYPQWVWNGDLVKPTISPSVLVRTGHYCPGQETLECWCSFKERTGEEPHFKCTICHSFITDGEIQFLNDCTHDLKGQTVDLPEWE